MLLAAHITVDTSTRTILTIGNRWLAATDKGPNQVIKLSKVIKACFDQKVTLYTILPTFGESDFLEAQTTMRDVPTPPHYRAHTWQYAGNKQPWTRL